MKRRRNGQLDLLGGDARALDAFLELTARRPAAAAAGRVQEVLDDLQDELRRLGPWDVLTVLDVVPRTSGPPRRVAEPACAWASRLFELDPTLAPVFARARHVRPAGLLVRSGRPVDPREVTAAGSAARVLPSGVHRVVTSWCRRSTAAATRTSATVLPSLAEQLGEVPAPRLADRARTQLLVATSAGLEAVCGPDLLGAGDLRRRLTERIAALSAEVTESTFTIGGRGTTLQARVRRPERGEALTVLLTREERPAWTDLCARAGLTPREAEVSRRALEGAAADEIAWGLDVSPRTVKRALTASYRKLGVPNRAALIGLGVRLDA